MTFCHVYNKDCDSLSEIGDSTIQFAMTVFPDYFRLAAAAIKHDLSPSFLYSRPYIIEQQIPYFRTMANGLYRVLKDDGVFILNCASCARDPALTNFCMLLPLLFAEYVVSVTPFQLIRDFVVVQLSRDGETVYGSEDEFDRGMVATHQHMLMFSKSDRPKVNGRNGTVIPSVWHYRMLKNEENIPSPFPLRIVMKCTELFSDEGDTVLDPLAGSGTLGIACRMGRNAVLYEIDSDLIPYIKRNIPDAEVIVTEASSAPAAYSET